MSQFSWHQILQNNLKLAVDASDTGADSVMLQGDCNGVDHLVCYFSKKISNHKSIRETTQLQKKNVYLSFFLFSTVKFI